MPFKIRIYKTLYIKKCIKRLDDPTESIFPVQMKIMGTATKSSNSKKRVMFSFFYYYIIYIMKICLNPGCSINEEIYVTQQ